MRTPWFIASATLLVFLAYTSASKAEPGLLTPEVIVEIVEESEIVEETDATGTTTTETITTTTTTTTITNEDSGDILDGDNDFVGTRFEGDMDLDWGGQGPASMPSGSTCGDLGPDKCAQITGSGNFTSIQGVPNIGTTFIQTIDISELEFDDGGKTTYSIAVDKNDAADSISFHITGKDGSTVSFAGTDTLSAAGVNSGFEVYTGGFDFEGGLTTLIVEVAGRDVNLSIGPLFDDVQINVLFNVISTIVTEQITTIETFVALGTFDEVTIDIATEIFENNDVSIGPDGGIELSPIEESYDEASYDDVVAEIEVEISAFEEIDYGPDMDSGMEMTMDMDFDETSGGYEMEPMTTDTVETELMAEMDFGPEMEMDMDYGPEMDVDTLSESDMTSEPIGAESDYAAPEPESEPGEMTVAAADPEPEYEPEPSSSEPEPEPEPEPTTSEPEPEPEPETSEPESEEAEPEPETNAGDDTEAEEPTEESTKEPEGEGDAEEGSSDSDSSESSDEADEEPETKVAKAEEKKEEPKAKAKPKTQKEKKQEAKQKAANKIVKKMGDKGRYDDNNQAKTLVIMQVLGNTRDFFDQGSVLRDAEVFYDVTTIPDTVITDNNYNQYFMFGGSDAAHDELVNLQYEDQ